MSDGVSPCFGGENGPLAKLQGCGSGVGLEICGWVISPTYDLLHREMNIQLPANYFDVKTRGSEDFEGWILPTTSLVLSIPFLVAWLLFVGAQSSNQETMENPKPSTIPNFAPKGQTVNSHPPIGVLWQTLCHISNLSGEGAHIAVLLALTKMLQFYLFW